MADNLESYFKKHLSDDNPAEENWNVPSDDVWDKVLPEIQKKRGLFIPWRYFYVLGILLVAILAFLFWPFGESVINLQEGNMLTAEESDQPTSTQNPENENAISTTTETFKNTTRSAVTANKQITEFPNTETDQLNKEISQEKNQLAEVNPSEKELTNKAGSGTKQAVFGKNTSDRQLTTNKNPENTDVFVTSLSSTDEKKTNQIDKLTAKSFKNIYIALNDDPLHDSANPSKVESEIIISKKELFNNKGKFGVGAFFLPTFTSTYLTGDISTGTIETSNMLLYSSNWGLEIRYFLSNRFTLVTGIGQSEVRSWSKSQVDFDYDSSNEHIMDTGEKENTSAVPMPTPFGEIGTEITYRFPGEDDIPDGEVMQSELETRQEVRYLSIPLGVEYNIIRFSRFSWFAETGIRYNRAIKDAASFSSRILHEGDEMDVVGEEMKGHPAFTNYYLDFYLGTGINYQISKSFQISGSARYFNSITKVNEQDNVSTHVRGLNLKIGIAYIF